MKRSIGYEILITVDGAKLNEYCIHVTCGIEMTDTNAHDPLVVDELDPLKRGKLLFEMMQT
jgi:hypothetical protein